MKDRILTFWGKMNGKQRRLAVWIGGGCLFLIVFFIGSTVMNRNTPPQTMPKDAHVLNIEGDMLVKSKAMENLKVVADRDSKVAELTKQLDEITKEKSSQTAASQQQNNSNQPLPQPNPTDVRERIAGNSPGRSQKGSSPTFPAPPMPQGSTAMFPPPPSGSSGQGTQMPPPDTEIGDIAIVSSQGVTKTSKISDEDKKKTSARSICLPLLWRRPFSVAWMPRQLRMPKATRFPFSFA